MRKRRRVFTEQERKELWALWKKGYTLKEIAYSLSLPRWSLHAVFRRSGGLAPRERKRSIRSLSLFEREEISRGIAGGGLDPICCAPFRACTLEHKSRDSSAWWPSPLQGS